MNISRLPHNNSYNICSKPDQNTYFHNTSIQAAPAFTGRVSTGKAVTMAALLGIGTLVGITESPLHGNTNLKIKDAGLVYTIHGSYQGDKVDLQGKRFFLNEHIAGEFKDSSKEIDNLDILVKKGILTSSITGKLQGNDINLTLKQRLVGKDLFGEFNGKQVQLHIGAKIPMIIPSKIKGTFDGKNVDLKLYDYPFHDNLTGEFCKNKVKMKFRSLFFFKDITGNVSKNEDDNFLPFLANILISINKDSSGSSNSNKRNNND